MKKQYFKDLLKEHKNVKKKEVVKILKLYNSDYNKYFKKKEAYISIEEAKKLSELLNINIRIFEDYSTKIVSRESEDYQSFRNNIYNKGLKSISLTILLFLFVKMIFNFTQTDDVLEATSNNLDLIIQVAPFLTLIVFMQQNNRSKEIQHVQFETIRKQKEANLILRKFNNEKSIVINEETKTIYNKIYYELYNVGLSTAYNINFKIEKLDEEGNFIDESIAIDPNDMIEASDLVLIPNEKLKVLIKIDGDNPMCKIEINYYDSASIGENTVIYQNKINDPYIKI